MDRGVPSLKWTTSIRGVDPEENGTKTILIIGGSGFVGSHVAMKLRKNYKVFLSFHSRPVRIQGVTALPLNIDNRNWLKRVFYTVRPDVIVYALGNNDLEWAEKYSRHAELLHSAGPTLVSNLTDMVQPRFIYLSNPYIFDGARGTYRENDIPLPWSTLGRMKLGGENSVRSKFNNYIILRSSPVFGRSTGVNLSFLDHLRMSLDRNQRIEISHQELHSFAPIGGLTELIHRLIESGIKNRALHFGGLTKVTHFEFARAFAQYFKYDPNLIVPKVVRRKKSGVPDAQILDFSLNSSQAVDTLKIKPLLLEESFNLIEQELIPHS
jgi:dTDP-4-dehydrorhamnose reductase